MHACRWMCKAQGTSFIRLEVHNTCCTIDQFILTTVGKTVCLILASNLSPWTHARSPTDTRGSIRTSSLVFAGRNFPSTSFRIFEGGEGKTKMPKSVSPKTFECSWGIATDFGNERHRIFGNCGGPQFRRGLISSEVLSRQREKNSKSKTEKVCQDRNSEIRSVVQEPYARKDVSFDFREHESGKRLNRNKMSFEIRFSLCVADYPDRVLT